jgi:diguanylate cyclase (GGDEF)-like protein
MEDKTILIVDDTVTNLDILIELLDEYDVIDATNGADALDIANEEHIDLILLDIMMPNMDGFEVCQKLKKNPETKNIPIIFITAKTDEESIEKAYDMGGSDYVSKPFLPKELKARVKKELQLQDTINELKELASTDSMTRLYNRRYFTKASQHILDLAKRNRQETSIIMLDIDKFKNFNDTYGHDLGDKVIIALANKLIDTQRKSDLICRYGGEEFVILLSNTSIDGAVSTAQSIRKNMENIRLDFEGNQLHFTVSIGVSCMIEGEESIEKALKRADRALYEAKHSGRNKVCSQV